MAATAAVSPSEYLQPAASSAQDSQPSPLALLAATCSKIGPPAVEAAVTPPAPPQPTPRKLVPIKPAPLPLGSGKNNFGILSSKGNLFQLQGSQVGTSYAGGQLVFAIQNPAVINKGPRAAANIQYQAVPPIQPAGAQTIQVQPNLANQIQIIPGANQAILAPSSASHKPVPIKPAPAQKGAASPVQGASSVVKLPGGSNVTLALPVNNLVSAAEPGAQAQIVAESPSKPGKKPRKKAASPGQPAAVAVAEQVETVLIETTAENIIQAGNNLLIVQSPGSGQPAVVQQVQVVQPKQEPQVVQIPQQALRVVQAASATLPTVPQKSSQNFQIQTTDPAPTQVYFKTPSGELQTVLLQEAPAVTVAPSGTSCSSPASRSPGGGGKKPATRKERPLPKIAPAGGVISLSAAQLAAAAQAMQTININGVQVQGVPVTITNSGGQQQLTVQNVSGNNLTISGLSPTQIQLQMEQALAGEAQPGEKRRRMACTCPNCKDGDKRPGDQGKKKHICHIPECGRTFRKTSLLRAHVRLHTGERPFVCNWVFCGKRFTRSDELQRHARTHTGDKRFECAQCQKRFMRSDHLTKHYKTHLVTKNLRRPPPLCAHPGGSQPVSGLTELLHTGCAPPPLRGPYRGRGRGCSRRPGPGAPPGAPRRGRCAFKAPPLPGLFTPGRRFRPCACRRPRLAERPPPRRGRDAAPYWLRARDHAPGRGGGGHGGGGRCGLTPLGLRRHGPGGHEDGLPGGGGGVRGAAAGLPRPGGAVRGLAGGGAAVPGRGRGQRHVPGHLQQGREALGPHGAAEGLRAGRLPLLHQPPEPQGQGAGLQPLRLARLLLGAPQPPGADRGLGEAAVRGGVGAVLPLPPQEQPDRGRRQPAEHRHPGQGVLDEEERRAGGEVPGHAGAEAGGLGRLHPAARRGGVLAGPNQPPARPHRLPAPAGRRRPPRAHDAARRGRVGVRAPRPLRLRLCPAARPIGGVTCAKSAACPPRVPAVPRERWPRSAPPEKLVVGFGVPGSPARPQDPAIPSCLLQAWAGRSHKPPASPCQHVGSNCSRGCRWLINHGNDLINYGNDLGTGKEPCESPVLILCCWDQSSLVF